MYEGLTKEEMNEAVDTIGNTAAVADVLSESEAE